MGSGVEPEWYGGGSGWRDFGPNLSYAIYELGDFGQVTSLSVVSYPSEGAMPPTWQGILWVAKPLACVSVPEEPSWTGTVSIQGTTVQCPAAWRPLRGPGRVGNSTRAICAESGPGRPGAWFLLEEPRLHPSGGSGSETCLCAPPQLSESAAS